MDTFATSTPPHIPKSPLPTLFSTSLVSASSNPLQSLFLADPLIVATLILKTQFKNANFPTNPPLTFLDFFNKIKDSNKLKHSSTTSVSCISNHSSNPQNPISKCNFSNTPTSHFSNLLPALYKIKGLASSKKWVFVFPGSNDRSEGYLQNWRFGVALLSVTTTARVGISPFMATLAANPTLVSGLFAWVIAQSTKMILNFFVERK